MADLLDDAGVFGSRCQYTSFRHTTRLADLGVAASVGWLADSYDNAMTESLNAAFKTELIHRRTWRTNHTTSRMRARQGTEMPRDV